jgi:hypothetical protein
MGGIYNANFSGLTSKQIKRATFQFPKNNGCAKLNIDLPEKIQIISLIFIAHF